MLIRYLLIVLAFLLSGCTVMSNNGGTDTLEHLQVMNTGTKGPAHLVNVNSIRFTAIKDTAMSVGAQSGLSWRANQIDSVLNDDAKKLDFAYNFYGMILSHDVLPPVLVEANNTLMLNDPGTIRIEKKLYKIQTQARFVTTAPTWRDYLWMDYATPDIPNTTLLPHNSAEQELWKHYVTAGWNSGVKQADSIFSANLARLNRDYKGMILYRKLFEENMVSAPFVAKTDLGITGNASEMSIGDEVLRIVALPQLNLQGDTWKPAIVPTSPSDYGTNIKLGKQ